MTDIGRLKELEAKATPAPWDVVVPEDDLIHIVHFDGDAGGSGELAISSTDVAFASDTINDEANAQLISELRNAAPHLLSEIETLRAQLAAAEDVLQIVRTYAHELNSEGSTEMFPDVCAAMHAYDQGKVTICDSSPTEGTSDASR